MKLQAKIKFEYSNGRFRKLSWMEEDPEIALETRDGEVTKRRPATVEETKGAIRKSLATFMREDRIRSFDDQETGKVIVIRFSEVADIEIDVEEVAE